jgi:repressor of nif and glnA expression
MEVRELRETKAALMQILVSLQLKNGKAYCFPTQKTLLRLLKEFHGIDIQRRALNYHLRDLVDNQMITRTRRIRKNTKGGLIFNSTLYFLKNIGYRFLERIKRYGQKIDRWTTANQLNRAQRRVAARDKLELLQGGGIIKC